MAEKKKQDKKEFSEKDDMKDAIELALNIKMIEK